MASVEVSTNIGVDVVAAPHDEHDGVLSPVSAVEPVNPMNNDFRMYTKSLEQAASADKSCASSSNKADNAVKEEEEEEKVEMDSASSCVAKSTSGDAEQENKPEVVEQQQQDDDEPTPAPSDEVTQDELNKKLAAPIPLSGARSRSFNLLPRSLSKDNNNNTDSHHHKPYPMHRALSFDSKRKKAEGTATKGGGIPLFRKLSFRGKKEAKEAAATVARPPLASPPKPPRPPTPPQKEEESPPKEESSPAVIEEKSSKESAPKGEEKFQEEKKETDFEASLTQALAKRNPSLISTRSKESESSVPVNKNDSLISTRSKDSVSATPKGAGSIIAELVSRQNEGKIQRTPTFQLEDEDNEPAAAAVAKEDPAPATVEATSESAHVDEHVVETEEKSSSKDSPKPVGEATEERATGEATEEKAAVVDATPKEQQPVLDDAAATKKEDNAEDTATETTEVEGEGAPVVKEETKNGLVINSSANEVEVSAGSGFDNFCEKFCCGLTLTAAPST